MNAPPTIVINGPHSRAQAARWVASVPCGYSVAFHAPKRSRDQNSKIHALCTDIARQVEWAGQKRNVEAWKDIFTAALRSSRHQLDVVPGINGGFVLLGMHTSSMSVAEASELIELILAFAAEHNVQLGDTLSTGRERERVTTAASAA